MGIRNISSGIKTVLNELVLQSKVKAIYEYAKAEPIGYPYIEIIPNGIENNKLTNIQNQIEYTFKIRLHQEKSKDNIGEEDGQDIMNYLLDDVIDILKTEQLNSQPLNNSCDFIRPALSIQSTEDNQLPEVVQEVDLTAVEII